MSADERYTIKIIYETVADKAVTGTKRFEDSMAGANKEMSRFQQVANVTAGIISARLIQNTVALAKESFQLGAQYSTLKAGFEGLTSTIDKETLSLRTLKTATQGMVSQNDLLLSANRAMALGLPVERMNELFDVASRLGPLMGRTVTEAVNDLSMGIGRQSKMILDNLGIVISLEEAQEEYAESIGKTANELTVAEKKQATFNAAISEAKKVTDQVGDATSKQQRALMQLNATVEDVKTSIGVGLGNALLFLIDTYEDNIVATNFLETATSSLGNELDWTSQNAAELARTLTTAVPDAFAATTTAIDEGYDSLYNYQQLIKDGTLDLTAYDKALQSIQDTQARYEKTITDASDAAQQFTEENLELIAPDLRTGVDVGTVVIPPPPSPPIDLDTDILYAPGAVRPSEPTTPPSVEVNFNVSGQMTKDTYRDIRPLIEKDLANVIIDATTPGASSSKIRLKRK